MPAFSIGAYLENFSSRGREIAYIQRTGYRSARLSYGEVARIAVRFTRELQARGIEKGDRVVFWGPNSFEWVAAFLGCASSGVVAVPIDDVSALEFFRKVLNEVNAKLVLCSRHHSGEVSGIDSMVLDDLAEAVSRHPATAIPGADVGQNDVLEIIFTSGTTSDPKGVVITHGNVLANLLPLDQQITPYLKYERIVHPIRFLNLLPLSHVFGQFLGIFVPQLIGGTVVFQQTLNPAEVIKTIHRQRVSVLVAVPRMLQSLKDKIERNLEDAGQTSWFNRQLDISRNKHFLFRWWKFRRIHRRLGWKFWAFICGGAVLDEETEEFWRHLGYVVIQGYGLTETTSLISVNHPFRAGKGSIGKVLAGREVKLAPNGEILVRGKGVASSYWAGQELKPVAAQDGWYATGDLGEMDAEGNLYFKGRVKDVIVTSAGMKVYPVDLEDALRSQPEIKDCAVVAVPQNGNAEPCAVLILREKEADAAAIVERANQRLAEYQRIRRWYVWPDQDFPRTSTLKPRTNAILDAVLKKGDDGRERSSVISDVIGQFTRRVDAGLSERRSASFENLSSLDRVELVSALEDRFQVDLGETAPASMNDFQGLERLIRERPSENRYHYPAWTQRWPFTWIRLVVLFLVVKPLVWLLGRPCIEGEYLLRGERGPVLVICNHISDVDFALVLAALPWRIAARVAIATAGETLDSLRVGQFLNRLKWFLGVTFFNLFPLPRQAGFRASFAYAGESVDRGYSILVFPEGRHTPDGNVCEFRSGIGLLAANLRIPIVPVKIRGLYELQQQGRKYAPKGTLQIAIGKPRMFPQGTSPESITSELQQAIERL